VSAYSVATNNTTRSRTWWVKWEMAAAEMSGYSQIRDATDEEAALMEKVVWNRETDADRERLLELIGHQ
jgi:hypothetical protein